VSESNQSLIVLLFRSAVKAVSAYGESTTRCMTFSLEFDTSRMILESGH